MSKQPELSPVEALALILTQVELRGREGSRILLDEYRDRGSLHVQMDGYFIRIEIATHPASMPHWWNDQ